MSRLDKSIGRVTYPEHTRRDGMIVPRIIVEKVDALGRGEVAAQPSSGYFIQTQQVAGKAAYSESAWLQQEVSYHSPLSRERRTAPAVAEAMFRGYDQDAVDRIRQGAKGSVPSTYWVAYLDNGNGRPSGMAQAYLEVEETVGGSRGFTRRGANVTQRIVDVAVDPKAQGNGLARALIHAALSDVPREATSVATAPTLSTRQGVFENIYGYITTTRDPIQRGYLSVPAVEIVGSVGAALSGLERDDLGAENFWLKAGQVETVRDVQDAYREWQWDNNLSPRAGE